MIKSVGKIIKDQREKKGLTKTQFAKKLGCSPQNIDSLESRKSIDFELAQRICLVLEFDLFDNYRVYKNGQSLLEKELSDQLNAINQKYTDLLERHNLLLENKIIDIGL